MSWSPVDMDDDLSINYWLGQGVCPICGTPFEAKQTGNTSRCDHEAEWYRDFICRLLEQDYELRVR